MKVKIVVGRSSLPAVGEVRDFEKSYALDLVSKGLAIMADGKQVKPQITTEGKENGTKEIKESKESGKGKK